MTQSPCVEDAGFPQSSSPCPPPFFSLPPHRSERHPARPWVVGGIRHGGPSFLRGRYVSSRHGLKSRALHSPTEPNTVWPRQWAQSPAKASELGRDHRTQTAATWKDRMAEWGRVNEKAPIRHSESPARMLATGASGSSFPFLSSLLARVRHLSSPTVHPEHAQGEMRGEPSTSAERQVFGTGRAGGEEEREILLGKDSRPECEGLASSPRLVHF